MLLRVDGEREVCGWNITATSRKCKALGFPLNKQNGCYNSDEERNVRWDWGSMTLSLSTLWLPFLWHRRNLFNMVCNMWKGSRQGHGRVILIIVMYLNDKLPVKSKSLYTALKINLASVFNFTLWTGTVTMLVRSGTNTTATGQKVKGSPAYRACFSNLDQALKILTPIDFTVPCLKTYTYEKSSMHING